MVEEAPIYSKIENSEPPIRRCGWLVWLNPSLSSLFLAFWPKTLDSFTHGLSSRYPNTWGTKLVVELMI